MNIWQLIQHRIPDGILNKMEKGNHKLPDKFQAKVTEQLDGALFAVQKGGISFSAKISGPVELGKEYVFHSLREEKGIVLRVDRSIPAIENTAQPLPGNRTPSIGLQQLQAQSTIHRLEHHIREAGVKFAPAELQQLAKVIDGFQGPQKEIMMELTKFLVVRNAATPEAVHKNLPFLTAALLDDESLGSTLEKVKQLISVSKEARPETLKLQAQLEKITIPAPLQSQKEMVLFLKQLFSNTGLDYENTLFQRLHSQQSLSSLPLEQLKPILLEYAKGMMNKEESGFVGKLINKITGFQLLSREEGSFQHLFLPIPVVVEKESREWYVHLSSKKNKADGIDPDYCRIVLYLDLPLFSTTLVDLFVQQRVITLSIHHSYPSLGDLVENGLPQLKENLSQKGYTLSAIKTVHKQEDGLEELPLDFVKKIFSTSEEGVDFRI
ncbi:hypothetical protein ACFVAD_07165 [Sutcliffiella sp. NPDC057660]|uniref:hypothetical protein n=1 Tax=Sutcliffiella sp. NPDC057660 TaxID=3346199 RepID=UPI00369DFCE5